jgi:glycerol-3-phosphate acyltransferase PlsX
MTSVYTIALDAMGGDYGLPIVVPAAVAALKKYNDIVLILVGDKDKIQAELIKNSVTLNDRLKIKHASQVVEMDEAPAIALRGKKDSSMRVAINLVKSGDANAAVSAGNTGALMATARFVLKMLPGIDRPAICSSIPSEHGYSHVLDLGANVDSSAEHLYQFAVMGSELVKAIDGIESPRVGLLNIGQEAIKGNEQVKAANILLESAQLNYIGYVEGDDIFLKKDVDLVVCDGFVGNIALKTTEGVAKMISNELKAQFSRNIFTKLSALIALPVLKAFRRKFDPRRYNGASLLGLQGIVIKSHGGADSLSYANAIGIARAEAITNVPQKINKQLEVLFQKKNK